MFLLKNIYKVILVIFVILFLSSCGNNDMEELSKYDYLTENLRPYSYMKGNKPTGLSIDILEDIFKHFNVSKNINDIKFLKWSQAYMHGLENNNQVVFLMAKHRSRNDLFKWVGPAFHSEIILVGLASSQLKADKKIELGDYKVGVVADDIGDVIIQEYVDPKFLNKIDTQENAIKKIYDRRIDYLVVDREAFYAELATLDFRKEDFKEFFVFGPLEHYYAFSKSTDDNIIKKFQDYLNEFKDTEKYQELLIKYQISNK